MATNGYTRISGGVKLTDINPTKTQQSAILEPSSNVGMMLVKCDGSVNVYYTIPVKGYKKISISSNEASPNLAYAFMSSDGTKTTYANFPSTANTWSDWIDIPSDADLIVLKTMRIQNTTLQAWYSLQA